MTTPPLGMNRARSPLSGPLPDSPTLNPTPTTHTDVGLLKEADVGIVADLGSLQRLPSRVGEARVRDWALTCRVVDAVEAVACGLARGAPAEPCKPAPAGGARTAALAVALAVANKDRTSIRGTKRSLTVGRALPTAEGLADVARWNAAPGRLLGDGRFRALRGEGGGVGRARL